jgi:hypothetical protein
MPPPSLSAEPLLMVTDLVVRAPVPVTSTMRKAPPARVMVVPLPDRVMGVTMRGSPSGPCAPVTLLPVRV